MVLADPARAPDSRVCRWQGRSANSRMRCLKTSPARMVLPLLLTTAPAVPQSPEIGPPAAGRVDFSEHVAPILQANCVACHGPGLQQSGLRLDEGHAALKGGYSGPVIVPGDSSASRLFRLVAGLEEDLAMPPAGTPLDAHEVEILRAWIDQGASWPTDPGPAEPTANGTDHWAFRPVVKPALPPVLNEAWVRNPIDRFVLGRLEAEGIEPSPTADPGTLARRVSLDLTGLPPPPEVVRAFRADPNPQAYEALVDRLLESQHYGERWAIQWLDLARYADSDGYEKDNVRPYAWRWRQWVIDALNDDMPFDRFTLEQIAGDALPGATADQRVAVGFLRNGLKNREGGVNIEQFRFEETVDRANTIGTVWLGLTVGCAQCHDHKYDLISQKDYYRLFAFMNGIDEVAFPAPMPGEMGPYLRELPAYLQRRRELLEKNRVYELQPAWEAKMVLAADNPGKWTDWDHALDAVQKYMDNGEGIVRKARSERTAREQTILEDHFIKNYHRVISKEFWKELEWVSLRNELLRLRAETADITYARSVADAAPARATHVHLRGSWKDPGIAVQPGTPAVLPARDLEGKHPRVALAEWLVSPENPLTARVTVNRVWQEYFGRGIVPTADDFGTRSPGPSHPELLDWLASSFMDSGWSMKALHKLIVTSATYRQSSESRPLLKERDPGNILLARQLRLRLPAELIRDAALIASGLLNPEVGGPSVRPPQPPGVADLAYAGSVSWQATEGKDRYRRGLYTLLQRTVLHPQLVNFDMPDRTAAKCTRERSNTPLQALNLLNDEVFLEAARALAARVLQNHPGDTRAALHDAFSRCLSRLPTSAEESHLLDYLDHQRAIFGEEAEAAEEFMPLSVAGVSKAEAAAWAGLTSVLLNLDEFITRE